jgi:hypothetical protein
MLRYQNEYPDSTLSPKEALAEVMKYIWLCHKHAMDKKKYPKNKAFNFNCVIHAEMKDIDNMWHTFLLFTKDYLAFCNKYLHGMFFHHVPISGKQPKVSDKKYEKELYRYLSYIADHLGDDTLVKWFNAK